jgi:large subunit ribosomal protein L16
MFLFPKKAKYTKSFSSSKLFIKNSKKCHNITNKYGYLSLVAEESGKITNFQQEAIRRFLRRFLKKKAQIFFRIFPNVPITKKPNDVRQGRGKGNIKYWACMVKKGDVLVEVRSFDNNLSQSVLSASRVKLSLKTFVYNQQQRWIL